MTTDEKLKWFQHDFISLLHHVPSDAKGSWGVLNAQQMVEHMSDSTRQANGKNPKKLLTSAEHLEKVRTFMLSDRPFRENTKNAEMPDIPIPTERASMKEAVEELSVEIEGFVKHFQNDEQKEVMNPFFGPLNFEQWVHLLHKHARHHARQFGMITE